MKTISSLLVLLVGCCSLHFLHSSESRRGFYPSFDEPYVSPYETYRPVPSAPPSFEEEELMPEQGPIKEQTPEQKKRVQEIREKYAQARRQRGIGEGYSYEELPDWWISMGLPGADTPLGQAILKMGKEKGMEFALKAYEYFLGPKVAEEQKPGFAERFKAYFGRREQAPAAVPAAGQAPQVQPELQAPQVQPGFATRGWQALRGAAVSAWEKLPRFGKQLEISDTGKELVNTWSWDETVSYLDYIAKKNNVKISIYDLNTGNLKQTVGESKIDQIKDTVNNIKKFLSDIGLVLNTDTVLSGLYTLGYLTKAEQSMLQLAAKYSSTRVKIEALRLIQLKSEKDMSAVEVSALDYVIRLLTYLYRQGIIQ